MPDVDLTHYKPNPKQLVAHDSRAKFLLYGGAVSGGKSVFLCMDVLRRCLAWNHNDVGIYRWEYANFRRTTFQTLEEWVLSRDGLVSQHNANEHWIKLFNGSRISYGGLKPSESAAGDLLAVAKSLEHSAIYIDEVTDLPEKLFDFLPTRVGRVLCQWAETGEWEKPNGVIRATCNPELGWVKTRWIDRPNPGYVFVRATVDDNAANVSEDYIRTLYANKDPDWIRRYAQGDWSAAVDFDAVCPVEFLIKATTNQAADDGVCEFGVDVGAEGNDLSVIAARFGGRCEILWEGNTPDTMVLKGKVKAYNERYSPRVVKVDTVGVGKGVYDALAQDGVPVMPMVGGAKAEDSSGNYLNQRAEIYWGFRKLLQEGRISLPNMPELINELGVIRYSQSASGRTIQIEGKKELKKRLGRSPDRADAVVYAFAYADPGFLAVTA